MLPDRSTFWQNSTFAVVGVSQNKHKFGRIVHDEMKKRGLAVSAVNPRSFVEEGIALHPRLSDIVPPVDAVVVVVPPAVTEQIVREAYALGITHVWLQPGAESPDAIKFCVEHGMQCIHGECILLQLAPVKFPHSLHRFVKKVF